LKRALFSGGKPLFLTCSFFRSLRDGQFFRSLKKRTGQEEGLAPAEEVEIKLWIQ
jgi:hypothetical protein